MVCDVSTIDAFVVFCHVWRTCLVHEDYDLQFVNSDSGSVVFSATHARSIKAEWSGNTGGVQCGVMTCHVCGVLRYAMSIKAEWSGNTGDAQIGEER